MGFDWKKLLGVAAPMLGTALGGPLGGAAAATVVNKLGLTKDGKPVDPTNQTDFEAAMAQAMMTPEQVIQLKAAEQDFVKSMNELGLKTKEDLLRIDADDRASARQMHVQTRDKTPIFLAWTVVILTGLAEGYMLVHGTPKELDPVVLGRILGTLDAACMLVLNFFFGSSAGSSAKNDLLFNSTPVTK